MFWVFDSLFLEDVFILSYLITILVTITSQLRSRDLISHHYNRNSATIATREDSMPSTISFTFTVVAAAWVALATAALVDVGVATEV